ncbi:hypothetical protein F5144DRAFT_79052 [Chaetomium tenue]|uniref:Uncharacterized protein n=1 Tax=Chaetomium tenue TaxID=1854479 RepID=A0ACB7PRY6_9PEZI|nr:hypothetical protein F5144DRAFT_79052 [Chaetomium globosum]
MAMSNGNQPAASTPGRGPGSRSGSLQRQEGKSRQSARLVVGDGRVQVAAGLFLNPLAWLVEMRTPGVRATRSRRPSTRPPGRIGETWAYESWQLGFLDGTVRHYRPVALEGKLAIVANGGPATRSTRSTRLERSTPKLRVISNEPQRYPQWSGLGLPCSSRLVRGAGTMGDIPRYSQVQMSRWETAPSCGLAYSVAQPGCVE